MNVQFITCTKKRKGQKIDLCQNKWSKIGVSMIETQGSGFLSWSEPSQAKAQPKNRDSIRAFDSGLIELLDFFPSLIAIGLKLPQ